MKAATVSGDHVVVEALHLSYERWGQRVNALDGVSISVPRGQWLILVGHNGSGKTSLLRVLSGRAVPDSGQAKINGKAAREMTDGELAEAYAPQAITLTLEDEIDISRGDMIVRPGNVPRVEQKFDAMIVWMNEEPMVPG